MTPDTRPLPSTFVTTTAWTAIVISALGTIVLLAQVATLRYMAGTPEFVAAMDQMEAALEALPEGAHDMFDHYQAIAIGSATVCLGALICSIGLLKRRNWGRCGFVTLLLAHIAVNIGALFLAFNLGIAVLTIALSAPLGWLAWRLLTPEIAAEFR